MKNSEFISGLEISNLKNPREVERCLESESWFARTQAIKRLGDVGNERSIKKLLKILKHTNKDNDVIYLNSALGKLKAKHAVPFLLEKIHSRKSDITCSAIYALGEIGDSKAIPFLIEKEKSPKISGVKSYCSRALAKLSKKRD